MPYPAGVVEAAIRTIGDGSLIAATARQPVSRPDRIRRRRAARHSARDAMALLPPLNRAMGPIIDSLRSIAPIAWIPMALLWLGIRGNAALFIVAYAAFFPFVSTRSRRSARSIAISINAASALGASRALICGRVILPGSLPIILTGARISLAFAWGSIIAAELAMGIKVTAGGSRRGRARPAHGEHALHPSRCQRPRPLHDRHRGHQLDHRCPDAATATDSHAMAIDMRAKIEAPCLGKTYVSSRTGEKVEALNNVSFRDQGQ